MNLEHVRSDRGELVVLCQTNGLDVLDTRVRRHIWAAQVKAIDRYVWVEDQEDIDWLLVDLSTSPIQDRYIGAQAA